METITFAGLGLRLLFALALVLLTFNPSGVSYVHWVAASFPKVTALQAVAGLGLLIGWVMFVRATMRSLGMLGVGLAALFFVALIWLIVSWGWLDLHNTSALSWIALVVLSLVLAAGMSWSHIRRRLSGQADVDEVDAH